MRYAIVLFCVLLISVGQILFKRISMLTHAGTDVLDWRILLLSAVAGTIYVGATFLWIWALGGIELSKAYLFMALTFVFVPAMSWLFLNEPITVGSLMGTAIVIFGIFVSVHYG